MTIQVFQPTLGDDELQAVAETMRSNWIGPGPQVKQFRQLWADHIKVAAEQVVPTTSATEGLFSALKCLGLKPGDEVILPAISFVGAANAVAACGAWPVFCDVNRRTLNPEAEHILPHVRQNTKAIILLHYGGVPAAMDDIYTAIHERRGLWPRLVEDCAIAPFSTYKGRPCGTWGDVGVWSFDSMKTISAGDGGMVYFDDEQMVELFGKEINFGLDVPSGYASQSDTWWQFTASRYGRKATMNDLTASILLVQYEKAKHYYLPRRRAIWRKYRERLSGLEWLTLPPEPGKRTQSSYSFYWVQLEKRDELARYLRQHDVYTTFRYWPLNLLTVYGTQPICPNAEWAAQHTLLLPLHQGLSDGDVDRVCSLVCSFGATRT